MVGNASDISSHKVRDNRLRRAAQRQGLRLVKSHRRDPRATDFGLFQLINADDETVIGGGAEVIEAFLTGRPVS